MNTKKCFLLSAISKITILFFEYKKEIRLKILDTISLLKVIFEEMEDLKDIKN